MKSETSVTYIGTQMGACISSWQLRESHCYKSWQLPLLIVGLPVCCLLETQRSLYLYLNKSWTTNFVSKFFVQKSSYYNDIPMQKGLLYTGTIFVAILSFWWQFCHFHFEVKVNQQYTKTKQKSQSWSRQATDLGFSHFKQLIYI